MLRNSKVFEHARDRRMGLIGIAVLSAAVVLNSSGAGATGSNSKSPFVIYVAASLSGPDASQATGSVQGIRAAAAVVNHSGGIDGHPVSLVVKNDESSVTTAVSLLEGYVSGGSKPNLVIAGLPEGTANSALVAVTKAQRLLSFDNSGTADTNNPNLYPLNYNVQVAYAAQAKAFAAHLKSIGVKKVALLASTDAFGQQVVATMPNAIQAAGIQVVATATYDDTQIDMTPQLSKLKSANPDYLVLSAVGAPLNAILKDRVQMGWTIPILGDPSVSFSLAGAGLTSQELSGVATEAFADQVQVPPSKQTAAFKTMVTALKKQGPITETLPIYSQLYDILMVVQAAGDQAHSIKQSALVKALENLSADAHHNWVTFKYEGFSKKSHLIQPTKGDFIFPSASAVAQAHY